MSAEINHWCVVCGKGYHSCDSCAKIKSFTPWRTLTDTLEHFGIFTVLKDYNNKIIDKQEAKRLLANSDLSERDTFKESAKKLLDEIFADDTATISVEPKKMRKKYSPVKDENVKDDTVVENKEEFVPIKNTDNIEV